MISERKYYLHIYENFLVKNSKLFNNCCINDLQRLPLPNSYSRIIELLDEVERNYEFNMQKMCVPNYNQFALWQMNFMRQIDDNKICIALEFVIFCCLSDKILDSGRFTDAEKQKVCERLNVDKFFSPHTWNGDLFPELDILLNDIRSFLTSVVCKEPEEAQYIKNCMQDAFESEIYMYSSPLKAYESISNADRHLLIDKSTKFETAAFLLSSTNHNNEISQEAALCIANIFWRIDDLCDFIEDIKFQRKNSILFFCAPNDQDMTLLTRAETAVANVDLFIGDLQNDLILLHDLVCKELYQYIIDEVWDWCTYVRLFAASTN